MFNTKYIRSYLRALRDYIFQKEEIIKSFALPIKKIDGKKFKDVSVKEPDREINFDKHFVDRLREIIKKEIVVSAHWEDMYAVSYTHLTLPTILLV